MRPSKAVLAINTLLEGRRLTAYQDTGGVWTIGEGHTMGVKQGDVATNAQVDKWVRQDFMKADACLKTIYPGPLAQRQVDALTLFINNVGVNAFATSTLLRRMQEQHFDEVPKELARWNHDRGRVVPGLTVRRAVEALIWEGHIDAIDAQTVAVLRRMV